MSNDGGCPAYWQIAIHAYHALRPKRTLSIENWLVTYLFLPAVNLRGARSLSRSGPILMSTGNITDPFRGFNSRADRDAALRRHLSAFCRRQAVALWL